MISVDLLYIVVGIVLAFTSAFSFMDRSHPSRFGTGAFWGLYSLTFLFGGWLPPAACGAVVVAMAVLGGCNLVRSGQHAVAATPGSVERLGNRLVIPALLIPLITVVGNYALPTLSIGGWSVLAPGNTVLEALGLACVVALIVTLLMTRERPVQAAYETRRLVDSIGWALVLPQILAMLGLAFIQYGAGTATASLLIDTFNLASKPIAVIVYTFGMAILTFVLGNAFAAFPVIAAGVGVPILVGMHGANPALMAAVGMLSAYCGSAMTPMNATYGIVPTALLAIPDKYAVIKIQVPTALPLLLCNTALLYALI